MTTKKEAKSLYEGKFFYEIVKPKGGGIQLFGPFDNIFYAELESAQNVSYIRRDALVAQGEDGFVQIVDGKVVSFFTKEEILVTDRKL